MEFLRIRLRFQNLFPSKEENSWYLLNKRKFLDVGAFLTDVKEKFSIHADKLRCRIKGFLLPTWEKIGVIRDEDEIVIEKYDDNSFRISSQPMENGQNDATVGCSNNVHERECTPGLSAKMDELPPMMQKESSPGAKIRHKKKRKHDLIENIDKGIDKQSIECGNKKKKRKKSKKDVGSNNAIAESREKSGKKTKVINEHQILPNLFTLDEKNSCKDKKVKDSCILQLDVAEEQKCKNDTSVLPDKTNGADSFKGKEQKSASSRNKKKSKHRTDTRRKENTITVVRNEVKGIKMDLEKSALHKSNDDNNKKMENIKTKTRENSFQILSRSIQYNERKSSQLKVKPAISGNHVYFESDEEDVPEKDNNISNLAAGTSWYISSDDAIGDSFMQPATTSEANILFDSPKEAFHKDVSNETNPLCKQANNEKLSFSNANSETNIAGDGMLASQKSETLMEKDTKAINNMEDNGDLDQNYNALTPLQGAPRVGDKIAFKMLEMSLSYTPEISDYKEALVQGVDNNGNVTLLLADQSKERKTGDGTLTRKFELESDSEHEDVAILEIYWKDLMDPKLLSG